MRPARRIAGLAAGLALALAAAGGALAAPPFWAVKDTDSTIYLFGTMHVLTPDADWRTPAFDKALASAAVVWFEADAASEPQGMLRLMVEHGVDMETPLSAKVKPETMAALREAMKGQPLFAGMAENLEPWAAAMLVSVMPMADQGFDANAGADAVLSRDAVGAGKRIRFFETPEEQLLFFARMPLDVQIRFLETSLAEAAAGAEQARAMEKAWIDGEVDRVGGEVIGLMRRQQPDLYDVLIRRRNAAWVATIEKEMAGEGVQMVNVGALHMVGDDGLIAQLRAKGFTVERVQ